MKTSKASTRASSGDSEKNALLQVLEIVDPLPAEERERLIEALAVYYGYEVDDDEDLN